MQGLINYYYRDDQYILNHCTKYLVRSNKDSRHHYLPDAPNQTSDNICEGWRFPIIDAYAGGCKAVEDPNNFYNYNEVTFIYDAGEMSLKSLEILGTFNNLINPVPLEPAYFAKEPTRFYSVTFVVPKNQMHTYRFQVDGKYQCDPINSHIVKFDNGEIWSALFTDLYSQPMAFENWELVILYRLLEQIVPFRTESAETFLNQFYNYLDRSDKEMKYPHVYRLDDSVGEINFIDNLLMRQERHRLRDYKICLEIIDSIIKKRAPLQDPAKVSKEIFIDLYDQMSANQVPDWDYNRYSNPQFFLDLLRRHAVTAGFSHPKYGGNTGAAGWVYLQSRYKDAEGNTLFDWTQALEQPLGSNPNYHA